MAIWCVFAVLVVVHGGWSGDSTVVWCSYVMACTWCYVGWVGGVCW
jgi:hypothetical protein